MLDRYQYVGIGFISFGVLFSAFSYLVFLSVSLTALGLSTIILGATLLLVPSNPAPAHQIRAMVEASLVNIEALLEEFDVMGEAVYLPLDDRVSAFIPIEEGMELKLDTGGISVRVLTESNGVPGVMVFPPGSELVRLALLPEDILIEDALNAVLVDFVELANSVKVVSEGSQILVELVSPKVGSDYDRVNRSLGSLSVSISGCVIADIMGEPVFFLREESVDNILTGFFRVGQVG
jgi:hypothetical protein